MPKLFEVIIGTKVPLRETPDQVAVSYISALTTVHNYKSVQVTVEGINERENFVRTSISANSLPTKEQIDRLLG